MNDKRKCAPGFLDFAIFSLSQLRSFVGRWIVQSLKALAEAKMLFRRRAFRSLNWRSLLL